MGVLGIIEAIEAADSFASEASSPVTPGAPRIRSASAPQRTDLSDSDVFAETIAANVVATLSAAKARVEAVPSSTTFAALALACEAAGETENAGDAAREALERCSTQPIGVDEELVDPLSVQLALEILFRIGRADDALLFATKLPLGPHLRLIVAANLAGLDRVAEAHAFADGALAPERDSILGFLYVLEQNNHKAVTHLRAALRRAADDVDSAMNLSIALWRLGSRKKALAAAQQATHRGSGRMDAILHYLELLLEEKEYDRVDREVQQMFDTQIVPSSRLLIMQARAKLAKNEQDQATKLLERAVGAAEAEQDEGTVAEVRSNLIRLRTIRGKIERDVGVRQLVMLHEAHPSSDVVIVNLAQVANRKRHASVLRKAFDQLSHNTSPARKAFIEYQIANLLGDPAIAGARSEEWVKLEPNSTFALSAAMVSLGIGLERWDQATEIAERVLAEFPAEPILLNNAGYIFAMTGRGDQAIRILTPHTGGDFIVQATLGLAYLSTGDLETGMRLYRQAAIVAEKAGNGDESLMTAYQALVVRQLGLLESTDGSILRALSLPPVALPDDWSDRPEYLRLLALAQKHGYPWPLSL